VSTGLIAGILHMLIDSSGSGMIYYTGQVFSFLFFFFLFFLSQNWLGLWDCIIDDGFRYAKFFAEDLSSGCDSVSWSTWIYVSELTKFL
jgi:hypothetical protein